MGLEQGITYRSESFELRWGELRNRVGVVNMDHVVVIVWHEVVGNREAPSRFQYREMISPDRTWSGMIVTGRISNRRGLTYDSSQL
jgi:hypothetical protein